MLLEVLGEARDKGFRIGDDWVSVLVALLVATLFIFIAARIVIDRAGILSSLGTALVGTILAALVLQYVGEDVLGYILAALVWGLVAALFFRTGWLKGAVIGLVAYVLWIITVWLIGNLSD